MEVVSTVFNSSYLVEKILERVSDDIRDNMELRLVNKIFRDACHSNFRKNHRDLKIECVKTESSYGKVHQIYINYRSISLLRTIAKVKVRSVVVKDLWQMAPSTRQSLHEAIRFWLIKNGGDSLKKLIGMDEICPENCGDCVLIPKECVEFGPLQFENLMELFAKPRGFEKLIVPDYLLDDIANSCIACSASKDDCFKAIHDFIPSNISCNTLVLKISESRKASNGPGVRDHKAMPQEVLDVMLKQWKVQWIVLEFVHKTHWAYYKGEWTRNGWFTKLCFSDSHENLRKSSLKFGEVTVDLTTSYLFSNHLRLPNKYNTPNRSYKDIVSNIRSVFQNDKLKIQFSPTQTRIDPVVQGVLQNIIDGDLWNFEVEISIYYLKNRNSELYFNMLSNQDPQLRSPVFKDFQISHHLKTRSEWIQKNKWIGNTCQFVNEEMNLKVDWTYFVKEKSQSFPYIQ